LTFWQKKNPPKKQKTPFSTTLNIIFSQTPPSQKTLPPIFISLKVALGAQGGTTKFFRPFAYWEGKNYPRFPQRAPRRVEVPFKILLKIKKKIHFKKKIVTYLHL
jgi:hypothetical protein